MNEIRRAILAGSIGLATLLGASDAVAQTWTVDVVSTAGDLDVALARAAVEAARPAIAECAPGAGPYRFVFAVRVRDSGSVRDAAFRRGRGRDRDLGPARPARCIRHALLDLTFAPAAGALTVTLAVGGDAAPPTAAAGPEHTGPVATPTGPVPAPAAGGSTEVTIGEPSSSEPAVRAVRDAVVGFRPSLVSCYASGLATEPTLGGDAVLHLTIDGAGRVTRAMLASSAALATALATCISTTARSWSFAVSAETVVALPLTFGAARGPVRR